MARSTPGRIAQIRDGRWGAALLALLAFVALLGGGTRVDIDTLIVLRPVTMFAFFIGLAALGRARIAAFRPLLLFALAILLVIAVQLVPLPPGLWSALPGREPYAAAARLVGLSDIARPLTLYPAYTWNALFAAIVPMSVLLLFIAARPRWRAYWLHAVLGVGVLSALLGWLQLGGAANVWFQFYAVADPDSAVGLFARRNHNAVLMALMPPLIAHLALGQPAARQRMAALVAGLLWLFFALTVLAIGSRLGLLVFVIGSILTLFMVPAELWRRVPMPGAIAARRALLRPAGAVLSVLVVGLLATANGGAMERWFAASLDGDLRATVVPTTLTMIGDVFPVGGGGGTFIEAYHHYETAQALGADYVSHVHNDYLEIAYGYGLPGMLLMLAGLAMVALYGARAWCASSAPGEKMAARAAVIGLVVLLAASVSDYPLRTPMLATIGLLFAATLLCHREVREEALSA